MPSIISAAAGSQISWPLAMAIITLLVLTPVSRPAARTEADDHLMVVVPAFIAVALLFINEKWTTGSAVIPCLAGIFIVFAVLQLLSLSFVAAPLRSLTIGIVCGLSERDRRRAEELWIGVCNEKERVWNRLLASRTMALWPVFAAITAAFLGLPDWAPRWQGDRSILVIATGALAFYGQRRGAYDQAQLEFRIRTLVTAKELAERDRDTERGKRDVNARDRENAERDLEIERRKQEDLLAALAAGRASASGPTGNLGKLELFYRNSAIRINAVSRITINAKDIVKQSAAKLFEEQPALIAPSGNAHTHRRMAACLRDMDVILRYITYATFAGDASILEDRCLNGLREVYLALGVPTASVAESLRIMKILVIDIAIDPEGVNIIETGQDSDYTPITTEIASYFDLAVDALA